MADPAPLPGPIAPGPIAPGPIAYVTGLYPRTTDTFIQREVRALRAAGITVLTCTVRRPPAQAVIGAAQAAEAARTFGVIEAAKNPLRLVRAHLAMMARGRWLRALALAWRTRPPGLKAALWQAFYFLEAGVLADHLLRLGVTHLHNHFGDASGSLTMIAAEMAGLPFSITLHGPDIFFAPRHWRLDEKIARAAFVACISHFCRSQAMLFSDEAHWGKLTLVRCGIDPGLYRKGQGGGGAQKGGGHVVFVGRLDPVKGVPLLLEAFARIRARHPGARLTVAGDGRSKARLMARAQALGLGDAVRFPGYLEESQVADLLAGADMLVLPSFAEGLPVVLMEALAAEVPVVATQIAGVPELVRDGVSGLIVPPGDEVALAGAIDRLLSDPDLCARMGAAGRARVLARHDIATEARWLARAFAGEARGLREESP